LQFFNGDANNNTDNDTTEPSGIVIDDVTDGTNGDANNNTDNDTTEPPGVVIDNVTDGTINDTSEPSGIVIDNVTDGTINDTSEPPGVVIDDVTDGTINDTSEPSGVVIDDVTDGTINDTSEFPSYYSIESKRLIIDMWAGYDESSASDSELLDVLDIPHDDVSLPKWTKTMLGAWAAKNSITIEELQISLSYIADISK